MGGVKEPCDRLKRLSKLEVEEKEKISNGRPKEVLIVSLGGKQSHGWLWIDCLRTMHLKDKVCDMLHVSIMVVRYPKT